MLLAYGVKSVNLRHLRYFLAIAETGNVTRAAAKARVAQPALSRQVRALERELGVPLLERSPSGVTLTPAGEAFARGARRVIALITGALDRADLTAAGQRGRVVLGA